MNTTAKPLLTLLLMSWLSCGQATETIRNLRVVWSTEPATQAVVVWDAAAADPAAELIYSTSPGIGMEKEGILRAPVSESGLYHEIPARKPANAGPDWVSPSGPEFFYHHAPLKNLKPGTTYYLAVKTAAGLSPEYRFTTAPGNNKPFKLIYAGDSRTHIEVTRTISAQLAQLIKEDDSIIGLIHGGDFANTTRRDLWKDWLDAYDLTTTEDRKLLPIIPVIGNHDVHGKSPLFRQAYGYPGGNLDYYTCHLTPEVSILCLNTEISAEGKQRSFLVEELKKLKQNQTKWQIAAFHRPAFPAVKKPSSAKVSWVPLFDEYDIDLVLESDGHCIKRTVPIRNGKKDPNGTVYLGEGGYGAPQRDPKTDRWYLQGNQAFASRGDHVMILEITPEQINYSTLLMNGETVDTATFKARR